MSSNAPSRTPIVWVTILAVSTAVILVYSLVTGDRLARYHAPLADAAMQVQSEAAIGHLWFEEIISGDRDREIEEVWEHLDRAAWFVEAMLEGGEDSGRVISAVEGDALRREIEKVGERVVEFRKLAEERWAAVESSGIGTPIDQRFDAVFEKLLEQIDRANRTFRHSMDRDLARFRFVQGLLIAIGLSFSAFVGLVFRRHEQRRIRALTALRESEERYRAVSEDLPVLLCRFLPGGEITYVNRAYCAYFEKTSEELVGAPFLSLIPEENRPSVMAGISAMTVESPTQSHEHPVHAPGGEIHWQRWTNRALFYARGCPVAYQSIGEDISDRKRAEEAFRGENIRAQLYLDLAGVVFVALDTDGTVTLANRKACEVLGYAEGEIVGTNWFDHYLPERLREGVSEVSRKLLCGEIEPVEYHENPVLTRGGEERLIAWHNTALRDDEGAIAGLLSSGEDITDRKQAEEEREQLEGQLRQAQKMEAIGQLAGGVAHDFNNLLQAMLGYGEIALNGVEGDSSVHADIEEVLKAGHRAKTLVRQLLAFSRRQVLEMQDVDLNLLIGDLMKMIRRVIGEHITLEVISGHELGVVRADAGQLEQILMNLCVNARDAMPEGGTITIETENVLIDDMYADTHPWVEPGRYVLTSVTDTGCGMDEETIGSIFEPFFTTKEVGEGTGLGLSTVYGLVKQHLGVVHAYSELDRGTSFKVYLPVIERSAAAVGDKIEGPVVGGSETILLAEDDDAVRELTASILERAGYTVFVVSDGEEALRTFEEHADEIDLALLDVVMPGLGGRSVFEAIRATHPRTRVLFSSGYSMNAVHTNFVLDEGLTLLRKPYQRDELLRKLREVLDGSDDEGE
jgi:two-component system, cell cycle sensor histidine kinase and response regulator CckA